MDYNPEKPDVFIEYLDKNGLYTSILAGPLPFSGFRWLTEEEINEMMEDHTKIRSCTLKIDLEYPKELPDLHKRVSTGRGVLQGGWSDEINPEPLRQGKVRGTPRSVALLLEERNGVDENSGGDFVRGAGLHEKVHRHQRAGRKGLKGRLREGLLQAHEQQRVRKDYGECKEQGEHRNSEREPKGRRRRSC